MKKAAFFTIFTLIVLSSACCPDTICNCADDEGTSTGDSESGATSSNTSGASDAGGTSGSTTGSDGSEDATTSSSTSDTADTSGTSGTDTGTDSGESFIITITRTGPRLIRFRLVSYISIAWTSAARSELICPVMKGTMPSGGQHPLSCGFQSASLKSKSARPPL